MSIIKAPQDFLEKKIPTNIIDQTIMDDMMLNINDYVNSNIGDINNMNNDMLLALDATANTARIATRELRPIVSKLSDVFVTGGGSKDSIDIFDKDLYSTSGGVVLDYDVMQIRLDRSPAILHNPSNITVDISNGELGNSVADKKRYFDIDNIMSNTSRLEIESYEAELGISLVVDLGTAKALNDIRFSITNFGTRAPTIESVSISTDGCAYSKVKIATSNSYSMEIEDFNFPEGNISMHIAESYARYIKISFIQKFPYNTGTDIGKRYAIGINNLKVGFYSAVSSGDIIIGPIKNNDEILKIAINSNMERYLVENPNIELHISHNKSSWIPIQNSTVFNPDSSLSKVINFNTVDTNSNTTDEVVTEFYLKVAMESIDVSYIYPGSRYVNRDTLMISRSNGSSTLTDIPEGDYFNIFKESGMRFGGRVSIGASVNLKSSIDNTLISEVSSDGKVLISGLSLGSDITFDMSKEFYSDNRNLSVQFKYDKLHVTRDDLISNIPTMGYDPFHISIFGLSGVSQSSIQIETRDLVFENPAFIPIIPSTLRAGIYTIRYGNKFQNINLVSGSFFSNHETIFAIADDIEYAMLENELGELIGRIDPIEINGLKYISLLEIAGEDMPRVGTLSHNKYYPVEELLANEYAISFGKVIFGSYQKLLMPLPRLMIKEIPTIIDGGVNRIRLISETSKQIKSSYSMKEDDLKTTIKLKHTNVLAQSVKFDVSNASINSLLTEVEFINGDTEFVISSEYVDLGNRNVNILTLHDGFIDNGSLSFRTCNSLFENRVFSIDELIDAGDYLIDSSPTSNKIILPEGVYTNAATDTEIRYDIQPLKQSIAGLYSIDYIRGILHTITPIDGNTSISYQHSNVYAKYVGMDMLSPSDYSVNGNIVSILSQDDIATPYLAIASGKNQSDIEYRETPILTDFNLNIIDARNSI